jgi:hypothetical protein
MGKRPSAGPTVRLFGREQQTKEQHANDDGDLEQIPTHGPKRRKLHGHPIQPRRVGVPTRHSFNLRQVRAIVKCGLLG